MLKDSHILSMIATSISKSTDSGLQMAERPAAEPSDAEQSPELRALVELTDTNLGIGRYSVVRKGRLRVSVEAAPAFSPVAVKIVSRFSRAAIRAAKTEVELLSRLKHPRVVQLYASFWDAGFAYIVLEAPTVLTTTRQVFGVSTSSPPLPLEKNEKNKTDVLIPNAECNFLNNNEKISPQEATCGQLPTRMHERHDLFELLESRGVFSEAEARHVFRQLCSAVAYLHSQEVCHMDIKDENVLIDAQHHIKIIDFGSACSNTTWRHGVYGTEGYNSPEAVRSASHACPFGNSSNSLECVQIKSCLIAEDGSRSDADTSTDTTVRSQENLILSFLDAKDEHCDHCYDPRAADMWALGVLLYVMLNIEPPYLSMYDVVDTNARPYSVAPSEAAKKLITRLMSKDVKRRWKIGDVERCDWMKGEIHCDQCK